MQVPVPLEVMNKPSSDDKDDLRFSKVYEPVDNELKGEKLK